MSGGCWYYACSHVPVPVLFYIVNRPTSKCLLPPLFHSHFTSLHTDPFCTNSCILHTSIIDYCTIIHYHTYTSNSAYTTWDTFILRCLHHLYTCIPTPHRSYIFTTMLPRTHVHGRTTCPHCHVVAPTAHALSANRHDMLPRRRSCPHVIYSIATLHYVLPRYAASVLCERKGRVCRHENKEP